MRVGNKNFVAAAVIVGLVLGASISSYFDEGKGKCERTEGAIEQRSNLSGAIACFEPGVISVNLSKRVEEGSKLQCVCRRSYKGRVHIWAISKAKS